jgi:hypothetical protein
MNDKVSLLFFLKFITVFNVHIFVLKSKPTKNTTFSELSKIPIKKS